MLSYTYRRDIHWESGRTGAHGMDSDLAGVSEEASCGRTRKLSLEDGPGGSQGRVGKSFWQRGGGWTGVSLGGAEAGTLNKQKLLLWCIQGGKPSRRDSG